MPVEITWLGHASVLLKDGSFTVYVDPWKIGSGLPAADFILITHDHHDHYSGPDIKALLKKGTRVIAPMPTPLVTDFISSGDTLRFGPVSISAVPAYNIEKKFHPRANRWVGYVITLSGTRIYNAGDTDFIPEMREIDVDTALIPVGGTYTMDSLEAARAVDAMKVRVVIPTHFGDIVGSRADAESFAGNTKKEVRILEPGGTFTLP
jgi:L-ascorbate metabolism protein UlaG (beta-lactamase superfamily)